MEIHDDSNGLEETYLDFLHEVADMGLTVDMMEDPFRVLHRRAQETCAALLQDPGICEGMPLLLAQALVTNVRFRSARTLLDRMPLREIPSMDIYRGHVEADQRTAAGKLIESCIGQNRMHETLSAALLLILLYESDQHEGEDDE